MTPAKLRLATATIGQPEAKAGGNRRIGSPIITLQANAAECLGITHTKKTLPAAFGGWREERQSRQSLRLYCPAISTSHCD